MNSIAIFVSTDMVVGIVTPFTFICLPLLVIKLFVIAYQRIGK